jgi:hypothetical protein
MRYTVSWKDKTVRVDYFGDVINADIESAHSDLNNDGRFYECDNLILDVSQCSLERVNVPRLIGVVAVDLGASMSNKSLKVAMIAKDPINVAKVSEYIATSCVSPWEYKIFASVDDANTWLN